MELDRVRYKVALAERQLSQGRLAQKMNIAPSTLSGWVNGLATPPRDWIARIEQTLGLPRGALRPSTPNAVDND
jgi:ribosome-binding protein aMBF1 (putative translation factor)